MDIPVHSTMLNTYYHGYGIDRNFKLALLWYEMAVNNGDIDALNNLGNMDFYGLGTINDYEQYCIGTKEQVRKAQVEQRKILLICMKMDLK